MKRLQTLCLFLSISTAACGGTKVTKIELPKPGPDSTQEKVATPAQPLSEPQAGKSINKISLNLKPGAKDKRVLIPYHFEVKKFKKIQVNTPVLTSSTCPSGIKINKFLLWSNGWVTGDKADVNMLYGIEEETKDGSKETIVLVIDVPSSCSDLSGEFTVNFK
jgi:hypothetical protein